MTLLEELASIFGDALVVDRDVLAGFSGGGEIAVAMVRPTATAQVQALARCATRRGVSLVPRGAGTGVAGGANASEGSVIVNFDRMNRIVTVDEVGMVAVVEPGVLNGDLKRAAAAVGLWYPPDPASYDISTLGGNVATNAGGLCCVKYGVTRDYVLGLEAVLADGGVLRTGGRTLKDVAGYDLTRLLVGSEGTLAMITEITLRLRRPPPPCNTLLAEFPSLEASGHAVRAIVRSADASLLEVMDRRTVRAVEDFARLELDTDAGALLLAQNPVRDAADLERMREACEAAGATRVFVTADAEEGQLLLQARRLAYRAVERLGSVLIDDVAVPVPVLSEMFRRIERIAEDDAVTIATVAHAGDGNLHPLIVFDPTDDEAKRRAGRACRAIMDHAIALGGTITGEHGVGDVKVDALTTQLSATSLAVHRAIKDALDPDGILNPGKILAIDERTRRRRRRTPRRRRRPPPHVGD
jgi:glycolate oxidase